MAKSCSDWILKNGMLDPPAVRDGLELCTDRRREAVVEGGNCRQRQGRRESWAGSVVSAAGLASELKM